MNGRESYGNAAKLKKDGFFNWTAQRKQGEKLYSSMDVKELEGD